MVRCCHWCRPACSRPLDFLQPGIGIDEHPMPSKHLNGMGIGVVHLHLHTHFLLLCRAVSFTLIAATASAAADLLCTY